MSTINGVGTKMIGTVQTNEDSSYDTVKWFILCWIPLFPVGCYRIFGQKDTYQWYEKEPTSFNTTVTGETSYLLKKIHMPWKYVLKIIGIGYFSIALLLISLFFIISFISTNSISWEIIIAIIMGLFSLCGLFYTAFMLEYV